MYPTPLSKLTRFRRRYTARHGEIVGVETGESLTWDVTDVLLAGMSTSTLDPIPLDEPCAYPGLKMFSLV